METFFDKYIRVVERVDTIKYTGKIVAVKGSLIESEGPHCVIGEICTIYIDSNKTEVLAEVVGLNEKTVKLMAYETTEGIQVGDTVVASGRMLEVPVGENLLGRVLDATGHPCDGKGDLNVSEYYPAIAGVPNPLTKKIIENRVVTGIRAIDALLTVGKGQRLGIFAGSGVGKSTLTSMIARNTSADINVIGLVGERGREILEFLIRDLGPEGLKRSVIVFSSGDQAPIAKIRAAYVATAVAEYFRDKGKDVMLIMDSVTRFCQAQRDIGTLNGEPPQRRGFPASSFTLTQQLLERTGTNDKGSITAFYTVLVDGGDFDEPVSDTVRGVLDGHVILSRDLFAKQHFPAIDILNSVSRLISRVNGPNSKKAIQRVKQWMSTYQSQEEMIIAGVYQRGNSVEIDEAIEHHKAIEEFLCQDVDEKADIKDTLKRLSELSGIEIPESEYAENPNAS